MIGNKKIPLSPASFRMKGKKPLYALLQDQLQGLIEAGHWKPNEQLPPERELAEVTGVSVNTVKTALHNLVLEGYLHRRQGAGTFVASPEDFLGLHRYYAMQQDFDRPLERHRKEVLSRSRLAAPEQIGKHFGLGCPVPCFQLERRIHVGGGRCIHTVSWLPEQLFAGFDDVADEALMESSLYNIMSTVFHYPCKLSKELLKIVPADARIAGHLNLDEGTPILYSKLIAFSYLKHPVEVRESYISTESYMLYREF